MKRPTLVYLLGMFLSSCALLEDNNSQVSTEVRNSSELTEILTSATGLRIVTFIEDGRDKTSQFSGYTFSFSADGSVTATLNGTNINGTYRVFRDDGRLELEMDFPLNSPLYELDDDWYFESRTSDTLSFEDSGDRLVFQF
jgi:hypothetical protein